MFIVSFFADALLTNMTKIAQWSLLDGAGSFWKKALNSLFTDQVSWFRFSIINDLLHDKSKLLRPDEWAMMQLFFFKKPNSNVLVK